MYRSADIRKRARGSYPLTVSTPRPLSPPGSTVKMLPLPDSQPLLPFSSPLETELLSYTDLLNIFSQTHSVLSVSETTANTIVSAALSDGDALHVISSNRRTLTAASLVQLYTSTSVLLRLFFYVSENYF